MLQNKVCEVSQTENPEDIDHEKIKGRPDLLKFHALAVECQAEKDIGRINYGIPYPFAATGFLFDNIDVEYFIYFIIERRQAKKIDNDKDQQASRYP